MGHASTHRGVGGRRGEGGRARRPDPTPPAGGAARRSSDPRAVRRPVTPAPVAGSGPKWPGARPRAPGFPAVWGVAGYHTRLPHFCFVAGRWRGGGSRAAAAGIGKEALHRTDWRPSPPNAIPAARESWVTCRAAHFGLVRRRPGKNCQLC